MNNFFKLLSLSFGIGYIFAAETETPEPTRSGLISAPPSSASLNVDQSLSDGRASSRITVLGEESSVDQPICNLPTKGELVNADLAAIEVALRRIIDNSQDGRRAEPTPVIEPKEIN